MRVKASVKRPLFLVSRAGRFLDLVPCPLVFWTSDDRVSTMNECASELTGFSTEELRQDSSLWIDRVHLADRALYLKGRKKLWSGERSWSGEYRFSPKGQSKDRWLDETSLGLGLGNHRTAGIISIYRDISELVELRQKVKGTGHVPQAADIIPGFIHEMENHLQLISGSLDLLRRNYLQPTAVSLVETGVQRTNKLLRELEHFISQPQRELSIADPATILKDLCDSMEQELRAHNIRVNLSCNDSLPRVWMSPGEFRRVVQTVIDFCRVLLPQGGDLRIKAGVRLREGHRHIELVVSSWGAVSTPVAEENVFRPFLKINGHSIGLSMFLAQQILARRDGKILFEKQTKWPATFTLLLRVN